MKFTNDKQGEEKRKIMEGIMNASFLVKIPIFETYIKYTQKCENELTEIISKFLLNKTLVNEFAKHLAKTLGVERLKVLRQIHQLCLRVIENGR